MLKGFIICFFTIFVFEAQAGRTYIGLDLMGHTFHGSTLVDNETGRSYEPVSKNKSSNSAIIKMGHLWDSENRYQFGAETSLSYLPKVSFNSLYLIPRHGLFQPFFNNFETKETYQKFIVETNGVIDYKVSKRFHTYFLGGLVYKNINSASYYDNQVIDKKVKNSLNPKAGISLRYTIFKKYDFGITYHHLLRKGTFNENHYASIGLNYLIGSKVSLS